MPMARQPFCLVVTDPVGVLDMQPGIEAVHCVTWVVAAIVLVQSINPPHTITHCNDIFRPRLAGDHRVWACHSESAGRGSLPSASQERYS